MKIGLIGYGNIAKKHEAAISEMEGVELVAVYDILPLPTLSAEVYQDLSLFLRHDLDIVTVCSPNGLHAQHAIQALESGKNLICEKPLALTKSDCTKMITAAEKSGKSLFCTMQNRYSPVSQWLRNLIDTKALGEINMVNVACYWNRNKNYYKGSDWRGSKNIDGGTLFTQFSHYVDTIYWLLGNIKVLNAHLKNFDHEEMIDFEDTGIFNFLLEKGGMGTFSYTTSCYEKNFESSMTLLGSKGTVKISGQYMDKIEYCNVEGLSAPSLTDNNNLENIRSVYSNCIAALSNSDYNNASAHDARAVVEIVESVYAFRN